MEFNPKRVAEYVADPQLGRLYERWDRSIRDFMGRIAVVSAIGAVGIQLVGNARVILAGLYGPISWTEWSLCAGTSMSDAVSIVTQCLAVIAAITIALVAAPRTYRVSISGVKSSLSFEQLVMVKWVRGLRYLAGIVSGASNAVVATMIVGLLGSTPGCGGGSPSSGAVFSLLILSAISTLMAGLALRPAESLDDLADDVRAAELSVTALRKERIGLRVAESRVRGWAQFLAYLACFLVTALVSSLLSVAVVLYVTPEAGIDQVDTASFVFLLWQVGFIHSLLYFVMMTINAPLLGVYWFAVGRAMLRVAKWAAIGSVLFDVGVIVWLLIGMQTSLQAGSVWIGAAMLVPALFATLVIVLPIRGLRWNLSSSMGWSFKESLSGIEFDLRHRLDADDEGSSGSRVASA